jgi:transcriptional regulator with XRE-family HTH domain
MLDAKIVGAVLREYRKSRGLTLSVTSGLAGMSAAHLSKLERGDKLANLDSLFKIAHALHVPPGEIVEKIDHRIEKERSL